MLITLILSLSVIHMHQKITLYPTSIYHMVPHKHVVILVNLKQFVKGWSNKSIPLGPPMPSHGTAPVRPLGELALGQSCVRKWGTWVSTLLPLPHGHPISCTDWDTEDFLTMNTWSVHAEIVGCWRQWVCGSSDQRLWKQSMWGLQFSSPCLAVQIRISYWTFSKSQVLSMKWGKEVWWELNAVREQPAEHSARNLAGRS